MSSNLTDRTHGFIERSAVFVLAQRSPEVDDELHYRNWQRRDLDYEVNRAAEDGPAPVV